MSVRFETQQEYKDKKRNDKRETLNILISDSAGMRDYEMFSGGEAFRVNFCHSSGAFPHPGQTGRGPLADSGN